MDVKKEGRLLSKEEHLIVRKQHLVHKLEILEAELNDVRSNPIKVQIAEKRITENKKEISRILAEQLRLEKKEVEFDSDLKNVEKRRKERLEEQVRFLNENNLQKLKISVREEEDIIRKLEKYEEAKEPKRSFHISKPAMAIAVILILALLVFVPGKLMASSKTKQTQSTIPNINWNVPYEVVTAAKLPGSEEWKGYTWEQIIPSLMGDQWVNSNRGKKVTDKAIAKDSSDLSKKYADYLSKKTGWDYKSVLAKIGPVFKSTLKQWQQDHNSALDVSNDLDNEASSMRKYLDSLKKK